MNKALRKAVIAGNWKMNKTPAEAKELLEGILPLVKDADCDVVACVPFVDLSVALETAAGSNVKIGAENCHWEASGAYAVNERKNVAELLAQPDVDGGLIGGASLKAADFAQIVKPLPTTQRAYGSPPAFLFTSRRNHQHEKPLFYALWMASATIHPDYGHCHHRGEKRPGSTS